MLQVLTELLDFFFGISTTVIEGLLFLCFVSYCFVSVWMLRKCRKEKK